MYFIFLARLLYTPSEYFFRLYMLCFGVCGDFPIQERFRTLSHFWERRRGRARVYAYVCARESSYRLWQRNTGITTVGWACVPSSRATARPSPYAQKNVFSKARRQPSCRPRAAPFPGTAGAPQHNIPKTTKPPPPPLQKVNKAWLQTTDYNRTFPGE